MTGTPRSTSASVMAPTRGGKCKEQGPVMARNGQGLWGWQNWVGPTLTSRCDLGPVYIFLAFKENCGKI